VAEFKIAQNFSLYTAVGIACYGLSVGLNVLLIDLLGYPTFLTSLSVFVVLFLFKFGVSVRLGVIKNKFALYLIANGTISIAAPVFVWLAVDYWNFPASVATAVILAGVFLFRYLVMGQVGLLNLGVEGEEST